ncbi:MAG: hypothetical protein WD333_12115 [Dehalococcoidia bacterium]
MQVVKQRKFLALGMLVGLVLMVSLLMSQLSADSSISDPGTAKHIGSTIEANGVSVTLEYISTADDVTTLDVSYGSSDGSVVQLLGTPKVVAEDGVELSMLASRTVQQNDNGTGMQMAFDFPAVSEDSDLSLNLGSVVRYAHEVGSDRITLPDNFAESSPGDGPVPIDEEITIGKGSHTVTSITRDDGQFGGSDANQFFNIEVRPSNAAAARQVFAGGASEMSVKDDLGNRYTVVSVSTAFGPGDEAVEAQRIVVAGPVDPQATALDVKVSHFGDIIGPWTYVLNSD